MWLSVFGLQAAKNSPIKKTEEWDFEDEVQDAEMVDKDSKKKK